MSSKSGWLEPSKIGWQFTSSKSGWQNHPKLDDSLRHRSSKSGWLESSKIGWLLFNFVLYRDKRTKTIQNWMIIAYHEKIIQIWMITDGQNHPNVDDYRWSKIIHFWNRTIPEKNSLLPKQQLQTQTPSVPTNCFWPSLNPLTTPFSRLWHLPKRKAPPVGLPPFQSMSSVSPCTKEPFGMLLHSDTVGCLFMLPRFVPVVTASPWSMSKGKVSLY